MARNPILSICIPTYNRLNYLKESLAALLPQAALHNVEICISDNHSMDGTGDFLKDLAGAHPTLRHVSQSSTVPLDQNMWSAIAMGSGQYLYPIGDDDLLPGDALSVILASLEQWQEKGCDMLMLNGWHTTHDLVRQKKHLSAELAGRHFDRPEAAFAALWDKMPFGSFLASRECFPEASFKRYLGTSHAYSGAVWDALADLTAARGGCSVPCMVEPTVLLRGGAKTWGKNAAKIMLNEIPCWFSLVMEREVYGSVIPGIKAKFMRTQLRLKSLLTFRVIGQLEVANLKELGIACRPAQARRLAMISRAPVPLAKFILMIKRALRAMSHR